MKPDRSANSREGHQTDHLGSIEVFWQDEGSDLVPEEIAKAEGYWHEEGWYWWSCQPGCLPEGEAHGPFATSEAAYEDASAYGPQDDEPLRPGPYDVQD